MWVCGGCACGFRLKHVRVHMCQTPKLQDYATSLCVIHLLQEFEGADGGEDSARVRNPEAVDSVSEVLQLESSDELSFALTTLRTTTRGIVCELSQLSGIVPQLLACSEKQLPRFHDCMSHGQCLQTLTLADLQSELLFTGDEISLFYPISSYTWLPR